MSARSRCAPTPTLNVNRAPAIFRARSQSRILCLAQRHVVLRLEVELPVRAPALPRGCPPAVAPGHGVVRQVGHAEQGSCSAASWSGRLPDPRSGPDRGRRRSASEASLLLQARDFLARAVLLGAQILQRGVLARRSPSTARSRRDDRGVGLAGRVDAFRASRSILMIMGGTAAAQRLVAG